MGAAVETFLGVVLLGALAAAALAFATRPFWPRVRRYFRNWVERDARVEAERRAERDCRERARREVETLCGEYAGGPVEARPAAAAPVESLRREAAVREGVGVTTVGAPIQVLRGAGKKADDERNVP